MYALHIFSGIVKVFQLTHELNGVVIEQLQCVPPQADWR